MKEKPILFSGPMVRAILDGRKTQTRRVIKDQSGPELAFQKCPYEQGGKLWVRETWYPHKSSKGPVSYRATWKDDQPPDGGWKPSIFMPRHASRITLEIVSVRVERVQSITAGDAKAEGCFLGHCGCPTIKSLVNFRPTWCHIHGQAFQDLWDSINAKRGLGWEVNPWVWVVEFKRV